MAPFFRIALGAILVAGTLAAAEPLELAAPADGTTLAGGSMATISWRATGPLPHDAEEWEAFLSVDGGHGRHRQPDPPSTRSRPRPPSPPAARPRSARQRHAHLKQLRRPITGSRRDAGILGPECGFELRSVSGSSRLARATHSRPRRPLIPAAADASCTDHPCSETRLYSSSRRNGQLRAFLCTFIRAFPVNLFVRRAFRLTRVARMDNPFQGTTSWHITVRLPSGVFQRQYLSNSAARLDRSGKTVLCVTPESSSAR